jgi:hypothetical protein
MRCAARVKGLSKKRSFRNRGLCNLVPLQVANTDPVLDPALMVPCLNGVGSTKSGKLRRLDRLHDCILVGISMEPSVVGQHDWSWSSVAVL